jgi:hypothetical protein
MRQVMAEQLNPVATHHLPAFITAPGETDVLMVVMGIFLALSVFGFGVLYWRLHSLPERIAHKSQKIQFELVAILGLISLFTHEHIFWIAGLLLAFIDLPDVGGFLGRIAGSVERMAGQKPGTGDAGDIPESDAATRSPAAMAAAGHDGDREPSKAPKPTGKVANRGEVDHV